MNKKLNQLLVLFATLFFISSIYAHAVVTRSSVDNAPVTVNQATVVSVFFNTRVKSSLSKIELISRTDENLPLTLSQGQRPDEISVELPALSEGDYALKYRVFAFDGHLSEGILIFKVE
ncbi:MAG: copper resistance protein CopC [Gammaproteobacteria bacterium]|nr:copper resistance protein CopC [Gammaproteobacteria bacterium]